MPLVQLLVLELIWWDVKLVDDLAWNLEEALVAEKAVCSVALKVVLLAVLWADLTDVKMVERMEHLKGEYLAAGKVGWMVLLTVM